MADQPTGPTPAFEPAVVIGTVLTVAGAIATAINTAQSTGANVTLAVAVAVLPLAGGLLIRRRTLSKAWVRDVIKVADTLIDAVRPIAAEVDAPARTVPTE